MLTRGRVVVVVALVLLTAISGACSRVSPELEVARGFEPRFPILATAVSTEGSAAQTTHVDYAVADSKQAQALGFSIPSGARAHDGIPPSSSGWTTWAQYDIPHDSSVCIASISTFEGPGTGVSQPSQSLSEKGEIVRVTVLCGY